MAFYGRVSKNEKLRRWHSRKKIHQERLWSDSSQFSLAGVHGKHQQAGGEHQVQPRSQPTHLQSQRPGSRGRRLGTVLQIPKTRTKGEWQSDVTDPVCVWDTSSCLTEKAAESLSQHGHSFGFLLCTFLSGASESLDFCLQEADLPGGGLWSLVTDLPSSDKS